MADNVNNLMANVAIVLMEPKYAENIGAAARSAMNMGVSRLVVVRRDEPERDKMLKMATHNAASLIDSMELHSDLASALCRFSFVVGTTARHGRQRRTVKSPREAVPDIVSHLRNNQVALLFGPEHRGLTNEDLQYCNLLTTIPTAGFSSVNLAQAVAIHCYELYYGLRYTLSGELDSFAPKRAATREMEGMYAHVEEMLQAINFLEQTDYAYWMRNIRNFLGRIGLQSKEVRIIRGVCRQVLWYAGQLRNKRSE